MKKILFTAFWIGLAGITLRAQEIRLNGYANYVFDNSFDTYYSSSSYFYGKIQGGLQWGAGLEYQASPDYGIELLYLRQDTEVPINYYRAIDVTRVLDVGINYIMLGGVRNMRGANERLEGYGGLMLGMVIFDNKEPELNEPNSSTKFSWGMRLGGNIWATDRIGLKVQTHLLSAVQSVGGGFYFGTGGAGAGVSTYSSIWQFSLGGGLVIKIR